MTRSYSSVLFWFGLTIAASLVLYHTSDRVNALDGKLSALNAQIETEQQSLHVLKAEWVYLANPARVDAAARRHLSLVPTEPRRVVAMKDIGSLLPLRDGVEPSPQIEQADGAPPASPAKYAEIAPIHVAPAKTGHVIAALGSSNHINERMMMPHTAAVQASTDSIGALIGSLSLRQ
jgi:hypothetical protein